MTQQPRVLAIGLDGYEPALGDAMMRAGELPALARLHARSARFTLDHGAAQRTGLAWEHVSSGQCPQAAHRWSAVEFDTSTYRVRQRGSSFVPFPAHLAARTVVFDPPYFDLALAPRTRGVVNWGAHDPGVQSGSRPADLMVDLESRFGAYPAAKWIYGIVWASAERTRAMGDALARATDVRAEAAHWTLAERLPEWDFALVVTGELHSAIEGLWHGVDPSHPLHELPSAQPANEGLRAVYRATDRLVGRLAEAFPDATLVVFAMGGMGPNRSDVQSMVLLPELLYRNAFGRPLLDVRASWARAHGGVPMIGPDEDWHDAVNDCIPHRPYAAERLALAARRWLPERMKLALRPAPEPREAGRGLCLPLDWMPAERYWKHWHAMPCFALPSFYDGRVRINLAGRERRGRVALESYDAACDRVEELVRACRDPATGEEVVELVERCGGETPLKLDGSQADLVFVWRTAAQAFDHPTLGRIGPLPFRRPGGHTGRYGMAMVTGQNVATGDFGVRSSFDVVPTIVELLGEKARPELSGTSLLGAARAAESA